VEQDVSANSFISNIHLTLQLCKEYICNSAYNYVHPRGDVMYFFFRPSIGTSLGTVSNDRSV